jgi:hypothetical protein
MGSLAHLSLQQGNLLKFAPGSEGGYLDTSPP